MQITRLIIENSCASSAPTDQLCDSRADLDRLSLTSSLLAESSRASSSCRRRRCVARTCSPSDSTDSSLRPAGAPRSFDARRRRQGNGPPHARRPPVPLQLRRVALQTCRAALFLLALFSFLFVPSCARQVRRPPPSLCSFPPPLCPPYLSRASLRPSRRALRRGARRESKQRAIPELSRASRRVGGDVSAGLPSFARRPTTSELHRFWPRRGSAGGEPSR